MLIEHYNGTNTKDDKLFSLAFVQPNTKDKYYVLPKGGNKTEVPLTIHKNVSSVERFVFKVDEVPKA